MPRLSRNFSPTLDFLLPYVYTCTHDILHHVQTGEDPAWPRNASLRIALSAGRGFLPLANNWVVVCHRPPPHNKAGQQRGRLLATYPQIAGVGLTEKEAIKSHQILVGKAQYSDVIKGQAMMELKGFTKAIVDKENGKILGFHIIGPYAPILIQEVVNAMALGSKIEYIGLGMHIHPALPELILRTFGNLQEPFDN